MNYLRNSCVVLFLALLSAVLLAGCGSAVPINSGSDTMSFSEQVMQSRINNYRANFGLGGLGADSKLNRIAQDQADYQAEHLNVGHTGEFGGRVPDRAERVGYNYQFLGEIVGSASSGSEMFDDWLASPNHRDIIIGAEYTEVGIGVAEFLGTEYWCVVFARPF